MALDANASREIEALESRAAAALREGRESDALSSFGQILRIDPNHLRTLTAIGRHAFRQGDLASAERCFQRVVDLDGRDPVQWINLALVFQRSKDDAKEEQALFRALSADPQDLLALILRGNLFERQGRRQDAVRAYGAAATVAPPMEQLAHELRPSLGHAIAFSEAYRDELAAFMDRELGEAAREFAGERLDRFQLSMDILLGRKRRYDSLPMRYFFPQLPAVEFFDRELFPWFDALEAGTDAIAEEFLQVLHDEQDFVPYITYGADQPVAQWAELNNSPDWSVFHLWKEGRPVQANIARCPMTDLLLRSTPRPEQAGRTPVAMFSLLKPRTRIPPHVGASNARLVCHLPLIVPEGCVFRVGNTTRPWQRGHGWVFDDTIEHEAFNPSDQLRVILIFDTWHPHLTPPERAMITAMNAALNRFVGAGVAEDYDV